MLVDRVPSSCRLMPQAEPGCRQSRVSEKQDGSDWQKTSPCGGNVEETRKPALFPFCCFAKMWASCLGQQSQSRKEARGILASHQSLCGQRSSTLQAALTHQRQQLLASEVIGSPRGFFLGLTWAVSEHSADYEVSCFSGGSATLGSGIKEADRGRGRAGKVANDVPEEVTSSRLASGPAVGNHTASSKVSPARSWS